jgi:hypothetical protein
MCSVTVYCTSLAQLHALLQAHPGATVSVRRDGCVLVHVRVEDAA